MRSPLTAGPCAWDHAFFFLDHQHFSVLMGHDEPAHNPNNLGWIHDSYRALVDLQESPSASSELMIRVLLDLPSVY